MSGPVRNIRQSLASAGMLNVPLRLVGSLTYKSDAQIPLAVDQRISDLDNQIITGNDDFREGRGNSFSLIVMIKVDHRIDVNDN